MNVLNLDTKAKANRYGACLPTTPHTLDGMKVIWKRAKPRVILELHKSYRSLKLIIGSKGLKVDKDSFSFETN